MSLIDSIANRWGYTRKPSIADRLAALEDSLKAAKPYTINAPTFLRESAAQAKWSMYSGYDANGEKAARLYTYSSWLQTAQSIVSQMAADQEIEVIQRRGEEDTEVENHAFEVLMDAPNPLMGKHEFVEAITTFRGLAGNAYVWINAPSPTAPPDELWIIPPQNLTPIPDGRLYLAGYEYADGSYRVTIPVEEIIHFKRFNPSSQFIGLSAVQALATTVVGDLAMSEWNTNYFDKNNAHPEGVVTFANMPSDPDWERLKADLRAKQGGTTRNLLMMRGVEKDSMNWLQFGVSQKEMEFIAGRTFAKEEIYNAIAPGLASVLAVNATEANALAGEATLTAKAVWPILVSIADTLTARLMPRYGDKLRVRFDDPRRQDKALDLQTRQVQMRYMTVKEIRAEEGLDPMGDDRDNLLPGQITADTTTVKPRADGKPETDGASKPTGSSAGDAAPDNLTSVQGLNGAQITAALQVVADTQAGSTPIEVARELFAALGIAPDRVDRMVGSLTPGSQKPEPKQPVPPQLKQPASAQPNDMPPEDMPMKSYAPSLRLWRKKSLRMYAVKGTGVCGFEADGIPADVRNRVAYGLAAAGDTGAIKAVFDGEIQAVEGKHSPEVVELASAIRRASDLIRDGVE